jgi:hypothetical protein
MDIRRTSSGGDSDVRERELMEIDVLGTPYNIEFKTTKDNHLLKSCDGYCDWTSKKIVLQKELDGDLENMPYYIRKVLRHEIVHAFIMESGLHECSESTEAWACNEEMVDWFARQGPKIYDVWRKAGALDA